MPSLNELVKSIGKQISTPDFLDFNGIKIIPSQLNIIGARPGMGKTAFMLFMLQTFMAQTSKGMLYISNEEKENNLFKKLACQVSSIPFANIDSHLNEVTSDNTILSRENIFLKYIVTSWEKLKLKIIKEIKEHNISCLFIDKLQGLYSESSFEHQAEEIKFILQDIKNLAVEFNLIIVASSSLNRQVDRREGKLPELSDLRGSGSIEEISDIVFLLHRPEYYGITEDESMNSLVGIAEVKVPKNRLGLSGDFIFQFDKTIPQFKQYEKEEKIVSDEYNPKQEQSKRDIPF